MQPKFLWIYQLKNIWLKARIFLMLIKETRLHNTPASSPLCNFFLYSWSELQFNSFCGLLLSSPHLVWHERHFKKKKQYKQLNCLLNFMLRIGTDPAKSPQTARHSAEIEASLPTYLLFTEKASSDLKLLCSSLTHQLEEPNQEKGIEICQVFLTPFYLSQVEQIVMRIKNKFNIVH